MLYDSGVASQLVAEAIEARDQYRTLMAVLEELAVDFWHGQGKLDRALASLDAAFRGYTASIAVDWVIDGWFAVRGKPLPATSRRFDYLATYTLSRTSRVSGRSC